MSHKAVRSVAKLISQSYGESQSAVCLTREGGGHLKATQALLNIRQAGEWGLSKSRLFSITHMCSWSIDIAIKWGWKYILKLCMYKTLSANLVIYFHVRTYHKYWKLRSHLCYPSLQDMKRCNLHIYTRLTYNNILLHMYTHYTEWWSHTK